MFNTGLLTKENILSLHEASLRVLEKTGIFLDHEEARSLCLAAKAKEDSSGRILLPRSLIEDVLSRVRSEIQLYDSDGNKSLELKNGPIYFGTGSDALYQIDRKTGKMRFSTLADVTENMRLVDALPGFDFVMSTALPNDVKDNKLYSQVFAEMVRNTSKPIVTTATCLDDIKQIHAIASIVAGGKESLREKPFLIVYLEPISPLIVERTVVERLFYCADNDIPFLFASGANLGGGSPITQEGSVVQGSAESLAGLVLAFLRNENVRYIYGSNSAATDMRNGLVCYGSPEWLRTTAMYRDLGNHYNLPSWGTAGASDSHRIDAQAALEAYESLLNAMKLGTTLLHDLGYLASGFLYDARMLVLVDEMIKRAKHVTAEVNLSDDNLALNTIDEVSRNEAFYLAHRHTADNFRKSLWMPPKYFKREKPSEDLYESDRDFPELLREEMNKIISSQKVREIDKQKDKEIASLLGSL